MITFQEVGGKRKVFTESEDWYEQHVVQKGYSHKYKVLSGGEAESVMLPEIQKIKSKKEKANG